MLIESTFPLVLSAAYPAGNDLADAAIAVVVLSAAYPAGNLIDHGKRKWSRLSAAYPAGNGWYGTRITP